MNTILFLLAFPFFISLFLLFIKNNGIRDVLVASSTVLIAIASIIPLSLDLSSGGIFYEYHSSLLHYLVLVGEILIALYVFYVGIKYKKPLIIVFLLAQFIMLMTFEHINKDVLNVEFPFYIDHLSAIMSVIIGVIGGLIAIFALGYMKDFHHHHHEVKDRRPLFFFVVFMFLAAMFGIVFSNNLINLYFFWEITTLASFILIGYKQDKESIANALTALFLNLIGGLAFAGAIIVSFYQIGSIELDKVIFAGKAAALLPAVLLSIAGITKAAQLPFSKWLLGAMVAPTPVSALLHSSTMVKAGVFIVLKMAPVLQNTNAGKMVALVGALTFLITSLMAITQSDAKRVLAYSTIANLGLIIMCAGIGTSEAVWAGILLIIFHALAKALLFLTVGTTEHKIGSRNIEDMDSLIIKKPELAWFLLIGMSGMFLAPFGMLISKWMVIKSISDQSLTLVTILAFGSAATLLFWGKWMGKVLSVTSMPKKSEEISSSEKLPLYLLAISTVLGTFLFPLISITLIHPYLTSIFGSYTPLDNTSLTIMMMILALLIMVPISVILFKAPRTHEREVKPYLAGANVSTYSYEGSMQVEYLMGTNNYYLKDWFGESIFFKPGQIITTIVICAALFFAFGGNV